MADHNVIYPIVRSFEPGPQVIERLNEINGVNRTGLAEFLRFTDYHTTAEVVLGLSTWGGMGDTEVDFITVPHFCIFLANAFRRDGTQDKGKDVWSPFAPEDQLKELSKMVGTELAQKPFRW